MTQLIFTEVLTWSQVDGIVIAGRETINDF